MKRFKLSRKRKKQYKKDLANHHVKYFAGHLKDAAVENNIGKGLACYLVLSGSLRDMRALGDSLYKIYNTQAHWEWFYFQRRVEVSSMFTVFNCPDNGYIDKETGKWIRYEVPIQNSMTNEELLEWYKEHYPEDKLAQHYCMQNRTMWREFDKIR